MKRKSNGGQSQTFQVDVVTQTNNFYAGLVQVTEVLSIYAPTPAGALGAVCLYVSRVCQR